MTIPAWETWQLDLLREEWTKGSSGGQIGQLIGKSRNAVLGKAWRLRLEMRASRNGYHTGVMQARAGLPPPIVKRPIARVDNVTKNKVTAPKFYPPATPIMGKPPIGIMELNENTCKAIVGRGSNGLAVYCGDMTFSGKPYCGGHCAMYYDYNRSRRRA